MNSKIKKLQTTNYSLQISRGFTLIEIMVAVAVVVLLGTVGLVSFNTSRNVRDLSTGTQTVLSVLRTAQSKTLAGENNSAWGVHLTSSQVELFQGSAYAGSSNIKIYALPSSLQISSISLNGGGSDVLFDRITGETGTSGTFTIHVAASPTTSTGITVDGSGKVYPSVALTAASIARSIDLRHRSFTLGWSIKTATTLTLTFSDSPNPDTVSNIAMASYFDAGKIKFDWNGTVAVGGINQILRIHTTSLSDGDTVLSIDRDCRTNKKKLIVAIDAKTIATYEADCTTLAIGAFGGSMFEP
ncbi:MAG: prepilin-type N-terminal cleavage/methylation domain-containing protein [Candidatus Sungbacteria bacterium]|nr:prepilin-type N-terminal cleavage/methylation domain-containing protein [bacterium]MDZ4260620.1 prepilin-type N-terminal cleavage/methylation domain-containing protein [Candidatus Sungbacteria bacterium]